MAKYLGLDERINPHLYFVVRYFSAENGKGNCFHRSAALVLDIPGTEIVMGTFRAATPEERLQIGPRASSVPFIHCWVEAEIEGKGRVALAPTTIETVGELVTMPAAAYREKNGARDFYTITRKELLRLSGEYGISANLRGKGDLKGEAATLRLGGVLLKAAGVPHAITAEGGVVPADSPEAGRIEA